MDLYSAGIASIVALFAAFWRQVRTFVSTIMQYVVERHTVDGYAAVAMQSYLFDEYSRSKYAAQLFDGHWMYIRPIGQVALAICSRLDSGMTVYWKGWRPLWVTRGNDNSGVTGSPSANNSGFRIGVFWIRGTHDVAALMKAIEDHAHHHGKTRSGDDRRHYIAHITGSAGKMIMQNSATPGTAVYSSTSAPTERSAKSYRYVRWTDKDLQQNDPDKKAIDSLSLSPEMQSLYDEILDWFEMRDWCRAHSVPWYFGAALVGQPGTGKSTFARAIAEDLDLPIYAYDLATLYNDELRDNWQRMLGNSPAIALFEDIDNVYDGRTPVNEKLSLSFDALLNCLSGVSRSDGLLVFVTTNRPERLDAALLRNSRIDRIITLPILDDAGRRKMVMRILDDYPTEHEAVLVRGQGMTGAQFQDLCTTEARRLRRASRGFVSLQHEDATLATADLQPADVSG